MAVRDAEGELLKGDFKTFDVSQVASEFRVCLSFGDFGVRGVGGRVSQQHVAAPSCFCCGCCCISQGMRRPRFRLGRFGLFVLLFDVVNATISNGRDFSDG